jgi:hypothetical protein
MTNPTSNFGWQMPISTDLVTDLPADFEVFGQAVDTSLADLKGGTTGQVLAKASNTNMDFSWVAIDPLVILDAKGDLITATAADTPARIGVGTNGQVLMADSTTSTGLKWAAAPSGLTFLNATTLTSSTNTSINNVFSSTYSRYLIILQGAIDSAVDVVPRIKLRVSGTDSSTGYYTQVQYAENTSLNAFRDANSSSGWHGGQTGGVSTYGNGVFMFHLVNPGTAVNSGFSLQSGTSQMTFNNGGYHDVATAYTGFTLITASAFTGSINTYGYAEA